ncbi:hypothetical protein I7I48_06471 [Histoplasma ohiense]|nr:hypothetical protein I7I48_06471 [Histoplasma ohiense (nom. inval.)]
MHNCQAITRGKGNIFEGLVISNIELFGEKGTQLTAPESIEFLGMNSSDEFSRLAINKLQIITFSCRLARVNLDRLETTPYFTADERLQCCPSPVHAHVPIPRSRIEMPIPLDHNAGYVGLSRKCFRTLGLGLIKNSSS